MLRALLALGACFALLCPAQQLDPGSGVNFFSREKETALGHQLAAEIKRELPPIENPDLNDYIQRLGRQIGPYNYTLSFVDDRSASQDFIEPIALPGGIIFVPARLMLAATNEAQIAGLLAHATAHIAARHGTRMATRQIVHNEASPLIYTGGGRMPGRVPLGFLFFARAFERVADRLAVDYMAKAGYDPAELIHVFEAILPDRAANPIFSAHPPKQNRLKAIRAAIDLVPAGAYTTGTAEFYRMQEILTQIPKPPPAPSLLHSR